jgi:glutamate dehydrogenase/leucine dehydrogenase
MRILELTSVSGFVAFDLDCPTSGGGTRWAPGVTRAEAALLARAMTYKFAVLERPLGGAKGVLRSDDGTPRGTALERYCQEITPMVERQVFLTSSDLGTATEDFASLPGYDPDSVMHRWVGPTMVDSLITGVGVVAAADTALGGLAGRRFAIEGFGKVGGAAAGELERRGGTLVALSTVYGCIADPSGLDIRRLLELRQVHGDRCVEHVGLPMLPVTALFEVDTDVLVPGARIGVIDRSRAAAVRTRVIAPAANVPYTAAGLAVLRERGILALADFVCGAGATIGYMAERFVGLAGAEAASELVDREVSALTARSLDHPDGPFAGATALAEKFLRTWRSPDEMPAGPPLAPEG